MSGPGFIQSVPQFDQLEIVVVGHSSVSATASPTNWTTVAHNLGYVPQVLAYLNGITLSNGGTAVVTGGDIPLPTYAGLTVSGGFVNFTIYIHAIADKTNVYFFLFNGTGSPVSALPIKYYLLRERSS